MERETPPPLPTPKQVRTELLEPRPFPAPFEYIDPEHAAIPAYRTVHSANSGRLHNELTRRLSLHMQATFGRTVLGPAFNNTLKVYHRERLNAALNRPKQQSLITVSNHQSTIDDPVLLSSILPYSAHTDPLLSRWGWCASELCFPTPFISWFFRHGKIVPITRGLGLHQTGFREAADHISGGEWMHIFPEGKCIPLARGIAPLRWGTAKLIADAARRADRCTKAKEEWTQQWMAAASAAASSTVAPTAGVAATPSPIVVPPSSSSPVCPLPPLLLPMVHHGMPRVQPFYTPMPKRGHTVRCIIGEPIRYDDLLKYHSDNELNRDAFDYPREEDLYIAITNRIAQSLVQLDQQLCDIEAKEGEPTPTVAPHRGWYDIKLPGT
jgi:1-acyl-sn-glycerol-3-phosphate acyltransferase